MVLVLLSSASTALADDDPRKKAAEATFHEGVRLHQQGKSEEALVKLKKAYETYPSPNTLGGIARVEQALGRSLDALRHYREALRNPLMHPENAEHARAAIKELEKDLARVDVKGPKGLAVTIDGVEHVLPLAEPIDLKAQTLELSATLTGVKYEARATAPIGRITVIEMLPPAAPATTGAAPAATRSSADTYPPAAGHRPFWDAGRITGVALFGVGVASAGAGFLFGVSSNDAADRADGLQGRLGRDACGGAAPPSDCATLRDARSEQDRDATLSTVFLVGGAVFAVAGAAFFFWPRSSVQVAPSATGNAASLLVSGSF